MSIVTDPARCPSWRWPWLARLPALQDTPECSSFLCSYPDSSVCWRDSLPFENCLRISSTPLTSSSYDGSFSSLQMFWSFARLDVPENPLYLYWKQRLQMGCPPCQAVRRDDCFAPSRPPEMPVLSGPIFPTSFLHFFTQMTNVIRSKDAMGISFIHSFIHSSSPGGLIQAKPQVEALRNQRTADQSWPP